MNVFKILKDKYFYINFWKCESILEKFFYKKNKTENYLKWWYKRKTGLTLNLENPVLFTEKQQWLKLYGHNNLNKYCDKYSARKYIEEKIGNQYLVDLITIDNKKYYKNANEIDFDSLPNSFVIQCNHGAHMTHIIRDKSKLSKYQIMLLKRKLNKELKVNYAFCQGYELQYKDIDPCIFITKYISFNNDLPDFKFFYFNGKMEFFSIDQDRFKKHKRTIFDSSLEKAKFQCNNYEECDLIIDKDKVKEMIKIGNIIAKDFNYVRVDFYLADDKIYFSELTFTSASGIALFSPFEYNYELGNLINISNLK